MDDVATSPALEAAGILCDELHAVLNRIQQELSKDAPNRALLRVLFWRLARRSTAAREAL